MIHLGDITKIRGCAAPVVDVVIGGSPCQDLSIAGKRAGLAGERSGLYMEQMRIIKEMRYRDSLRGRTDELVRPRYMVWENVPGAFSSNGGKDFGAVIEEALRVIEPEAPAVPVPPKGWPTSGCLVGDGWSIAWRVLDAQFWGVPQRRRRIALVADFGGHTAPEILFVRESLSGHPQPGGTAGERPSGGPESGTAYAVRVRGGCDGGGKGALVQEEKAGTLGVNNDQTIICLNDQGGSVMGVSQDVSGALRAQEHGHQPTILDMSHACDVIRDCGGISPSLQARMGTGGNQVPLCFRESGRSQYIENSICGTQMAEAAKRAVDLVCAVDCRNGHENPETNGTLQSHSGSGQSLNLNNVVREGVTVRRLTPLECERLQGFPDGWTDIGDWADSNGKKRKTTDSARYKALGNSIALPPWKWVLKRLCAQYERDATMASLFDGIGGFPLIWEQLNGKGSCVWASEIEEFPMAVTRRHF